MSKQSWSVFNCVWRPSIEHNKTFLWPIFFFILFCINLYEICIFYHFKIFLPKVCWSCQYRWFVMVRHFNIWVTRKNTKILRFHFLKKVLTDLVWQLLILFNSWRFLIHQRTKMFSKNYWFRTGFVVVWYTSI